MMFWPRTKAGRVSRQDDRKRKDGPAAIVFSFIRGAALATIVGLVLGLAVRGRDLAMIILAIFLAAAIGLLLGVASARGKI